MKFIVAIVVSLFISFVAYSTNAKQTEIYGSIESWIPQTKLLMLCKEWELYKIEERDPMNKYNPVYITQVSTTNKDVYEKYEFTSNGRYRHEKNSVIETGVWISDKEFTMLGLFTDTINGNYSSNYDDNKNKNDFGCPLYCKQRKIELTDSDLTITWSGRDGGVIYYYRMMK